MGTSTALLRLVLLQGTERMDVAVTPEARVADVLHSAGVGHVDRVLVTTSAGREVNLQGLISQEARDGEVLSVVDRDDAITPGVENGLVSPARFRRLRAGLTRWLVCALGIAMVAVLVGTHVAVLAAGQDHPPWLGLAMPALLAGAGVVLAIRRAPHDAAAADAAVTPATADDASRHSGHRPAEHGVLEETVLAPVLGFAAGFLVTGPEQYGALRLSVVLGLLSAAVLAVLRYSVSAREQDSSAGVAAVLAGVWTVVAGLFAAALLLDLPGYVVPALLLGGAPLMIRSMPSAALEIPDEQVLDMPFLARTAISVRGVLPKSPGRARSERVAERIRRSEHRERAGKISASVIVVVTAPVVLATYEPGGLRGWGTVALVALVLVFLTLAPRSFRRPVDKVAPRLALVTVLAQLALGTHRFPDAVAWGFVAIVVAVGFAFLAVPLARGYRSVRFSRLGDIVEGFSVGLVLPAALLAAGAVQGLGTLTAG